MIIFLYGQDTYRSRGELRKIIEDYKKANLDWFDFVRIDTSDKETKVFEQIRQTTNTVSMFGSRKLIIIENIFLIDEELQESVLEFLRYKNLETNKDIIIVFWSEEVDKQNNLFKFFKTKAKCQEFGPLKGVQLRNWIKNYVSEQDGKIETQALDKLIEYVGSDLWRTNNEINKLVSYKMGDVRRPTSQAISIVDVELLIRPEIDLKIFNLIDAMGYKNKNKALKLFKQYLEKGENENYVLSMFIYQIRNLIKVKAGGKLDMRYFVIQKSREQAKNFSFEELKKIYRRLLAIDLDIKTGRTDTTTALELFLTAL